MENEQDRSIIHAEENATRMTPQLSPEVLEKLVTSGDMSKMTSAQRVDFYNFICQSVGLNPATKPFEYLMLNGRLVLYATRNCTDQLCNTYKISTSILSEEMLDRDLYKVRARAQNPVRHSESTGVVNLAGSSGDNRANLIMKAETKAKRRAVLSLVGLSFLDETEVDTIQGAERVLPQPTQPSVSPVTLDRSRAAEFVAKPKEEPAAARPAPVERPEKAPFWVSEFQGKSYIHVRPGDHFPAEWLEERGFKRGAKTYHQEASDSVWQDLTQRFEKVDQALSTTPQIDETYIAACRVGFRNMNLFGADVLKVLDELGVPRDSREWTMENYETIKAWLTEHEPVGF